MKALVDGDILLYEVGFGAETGWKAITGEDALPPFSYIESFLNTRVANIVGMAGASSHSLFLTKGTSFRSNIATLKPYKGQRINHKPWHYDNLRVYLEHILGAEVVEGIEADDAMAITHTLDPSNTIICSRDKDLRQLPGAFYSWENGEQPSFGPVLIKPDGWVELSEDRKKLTGTGFAWFCAQVLIGDVVDNIPGLPRTGPVGAYELLSGYSSSRDMLSALHEAYRGHYGDDEWEERLLEQGRLCWMTRRLHEDGSPVLWELDMIE